MSKEYPYYTFLISLGTSIMGGAVAGFLLIQNPDWTGYMILLIVGGSLTFFGIRDLKKKRQH
jgi:predicted permease